jgi:DNA-binding IclR family transcriptional regulator
LDVFSAIGRGETTAARIAHATGAAERGVRILCDFLVVIGILTKSPDGAYGLTPTPAYSSTAARRRTWAGR